jgi:hypothetical protein
VGFLGASRFSFELADMRVFNAEIVIDKWPWLAPYIEIEANNEHIVRKIAEALGLSWGDAIFGDVMAAYRVQYPHLAPFDTIASIRNVTFDSPLPDILKD